MRHATLISRGAVAEGRRAALSVLSQTASSLTSFLIGVGIGRITTVEEFGEFGLLFGGSLLIASLVRSYLVEPLVVEVSAGRTRPHAASVLGAALIMALVPATLLLCGLLATGPELGAGAILAGSVGVVLAVSQDAFKSFAIGSRSPSAALASDVTWLVVQIGVTGFVVSGDLGTTMALWGWGAGALAGMIAGTVAIGAGMPEPIVGIKTAWGLRKVGLSWVADSFAVNLVGQAMPWLLVVLGGLSSVAEYRGALILLGPTTLILTGLRLTTLSLLASSPRAQVEPRTRWLSLAFAGISLLSGVPFLLLPEQVGSELLGDSWGAARGALLYALVWRVAASATTPWLLGMRALGATREILTVRLRVSALAAVGGAVGAATGGAAGAFVGLAASSAASVPMWHRGMRRTVATVESSFGQ